MVAYQEIKAFVGHSFTPNDDAVVAAFLKYFDQLKDLLPHFSWEHAEAAEPVELAEKVRAKFADKNVFIGICTAKEFAVSESALSPLLLRPDFRKVRTREFESKTSDWIAQEIGYALGRGMDIIVLQENGIRRPGGLQGDREYIPFERERPEKAFGKVLEMLSALLPRMVVSGAATGDIPKPNDSSQLAKNQGNDWADPKPDWNETRYRTALLHLVADGKTDDADAVYEKFAKSVAGESDDKAAGLAAHLEFLKLVFGRGGKLERLIDLAKKYPKNVDVLVNLARSQRQFDNHLAAAQTFETAAGLDGNSEGGPFLFGQAALEFAKSGHTERAQALVEHIKTSARSNEQVERQLAHVIRDLMEFKKDEDALVAALERTVDLSPDDYDARFSLAYKHSELGNEDLALHHYLKIPYESRNGVTWNNLGVSFKHFSMASASIRAYRKAEQLGETIAMGNLGYQLMNQGFTDEAKTLFQKGFLIENHHKSIEEGLSELAKIPEQEEAKQKEVLDKAVPKADFYRALANAISASQMTTLPSKLRAKECVLTVTVNGDEFSAVGTYQRDDTNVLGALSGSLLSSVKQIREYRIEYVGHITGRQIQATVSRVQTTGPQGLLSSLDSAKTKVLMYLDDNGCDLRVMENAHSTSPSFYTLSAG